MTRVSPILQFPRPRELPSTLEIICLAVTRCQVLSPRSSKRVLGPRESSRVSVSPQSRKALDSSNENSPVTFTSISRPARDNCSDDRAHDYPAVQVDGLEASGSRLGVEVSLVNTPLKGPRACANSTRKHLSLALLSHLQPRVTIVTSIRGLWDVFFVRPTVWSGRITPEMHVYF